ncbi:MAG: hypothetical protein Q9161_000627 [Pseudevernia consocians]
MTKLTLLPNDILHALLTHLSPYKPTLRNLAFAHPRFTLLTPTYLLNILELCIRHEDETFSRTFLRLLRSISQEPRLANLLRNIKLYWYSSWANDLLSRLRNLHSLTLLAGGPGKLYMPLTFLDSNPMPHLRTLTISDSESTLSDIFTYTVSLLSLPLLYINALNFPTTLPPPITIPSSAQKSAPLQTLHLNSFHLPTSTPSTSPPQPCTPSSSPPRALQTLHCLIPARELRDPLGGSFPDSEMLEPLSAANVASSLQPARETLVELWVLANAGEDRWPGREGGRLDLSDFARLKLDFNFNSSILNLDRNEEQKTFNEQHQQFVESEKWKYAWPQELLS